MLNVILLKLNDLLERGENQTESPLKQTLYIYKKIIAAMHPYLQGIVACLHKIAKVHNVHIYEDNQSLSFPII